ncbi:hypothetical protein LTR85_006150 [Meristemomyces frigidus]|nr:hypothetical protein LTR85_006150 [Meristemomyces frigidus]
MSRELHCSRLNADYFSHVEGKTAKRFDHSNTGMLLKEYGARKHRFRIFRPAKVKTE